MPLLPRATGSAVIPTIFRGRKYENDAPSPVECEAEVGELQPEYFRTLGSWQKRWGQISPGF